MDSRVMREKHAEGKTNMKNFPPKSRLSALSCKPQPNSFRRISMHSHNRIGTPALLLAFAALLAATVSLAENKIMGQVNFVPATKVEKNAGIWVDGQYVGYVDELKGNKKIVLLPGKHEITARASGYKDFTRNIVVEPGKSVDVTIQMVRDPSVKYAAVTSQIKIKVQPDRAAVFLDGAFVGYVHEFGGVGRAMLVNPGKHLIKIALPGYHDFVAEIVLVPKQKYTIKTKLEPASITQADSSIKKK
jgi:PEGA domain